MKEEGMYIRVNGTWLAYESGAVTTTKTFRNAARHLTMSHLLKGMRWAKDHGHKIEVVTVELNLEPVPDYIIEEGVTDEINAYLRKMPPELLDHFDKVYKRA